MTVIKRNRNIIKSSNNQPDRPKRIKRSDKTAEAGRKGSGAGLFQRTMET
jgi:hypothetical protein